MYFISRYRKEHVPYTFNTLEPYYNCHTAEFLISTDEEPVGILRIPVTWASCRLKSTTRPFVQQLVRANELKNTSKLCIIGPL